MFPCFKRSAGELLHFQVQEYAHGLKGSDRLDGQSPCFFASMPHKYSCRFFFLSTLPSSAVTAGGLQSLYFCEVTSYVQATEDSVEMFFCLKSTRSGFTPASPPIRFTFCKTSTGRGEAALPWEPALRCERHLEISARVLHKERKISQRRTSSGSFGLEREGTFEGHFSQKTGRFQSLLSVARHLCNELLHTEGGFLKTAPLIDSALK